MSYLTNDIESFIKAMIEGDVEIEFQRNELAEHFGCTPSQINYVLATRFTLDDGYVVESRRGARGFIRVPRISQDASSVLRELITSRIGDQLSLSDALKIILRLCDDGVISERDAGLMASAVQDAPLPSRPIRDTLRASTLKSMLIWLIKEGGEQSHVV